MSTGIIPSVRLANDIAAQFAHRLDPAAAATEMARHIRDFWEPRMVAALVAVAEEPSAGLDPLAARAADLLR